MPATASRPTLRLRLLVYPHGQRGKAYQGDKFVITQHGKCCCQPPQQKEYNVVSFIKEHPTLFAEYYEKWTASYALLNMPDGRRTPKYDRST